MGGKIVQLEKSFKSRRGTSRVFKNEIFSSRSKPIWHAGRSRVLEWILIKQIEQVMISFWYLAINSYMLIKAGILKYWANRAWRHIKMGWSHKTLKTFTMNSLSPHSSALTNYIPPFRFLLSCYYIKVQAPWHDLWNFPHLLFPGLCIGI